MLLQKMSRVLNKATDIKEMKKHLLGTTLLSINVFGVRAADRLSICSLVT